MAGGTDVFVMGRFPPPLDGQTLATERIASFLESRYRVERLNTQVPGEDFVRADGGFDAARAWHYVRTRSRLRKAMSSAPTAPVLWNSISPMPIGHWRDVLLSLPAFQPEQPVIAVAHRATFDALFSSLTTRFTSRMMRRRLQAFVFQTESLSADCAPWLAEEKRHVIPNTVDDDLLCSDQDVSEKSAPDVASEPLRILFVSNMMPEKGYIDVLRSVAVLRKRGQDVHADFIGRWTSDASEMDFMRIAGETGIAKAVVHHGGTLGRDRIKQLQLAAHVFVLPTYHPTETQPKAVLEALGAGTPVVTTRQGGLTEVVEDGVEGFFVPPRSPEAIASAVEKLIDLPRWREASAAARSRFNRQFHPEVVRRQWIGLVEDVMETTEITTTA